MYLFHKKLLYTDTWRTKIYMLKKMPKFKDKHFSVDIRMVVASKMGILEDDTNVLS